MHAAPITTSKRIIYNTGFNILTHVLTALIGFCLIKFFLTHLGETRYGIWVLVASIFRYRMMLTMGLNSAVNRYVPVCLAQQDEKGIARVASTAFFSLLVVGGLLALLSILVYFNLGQWFEILPEHISTAGILVLTVGFSFAMVMPLQLASALLSSIQRYDIINSVTLVLLVARTFLLVILLRGGFGLLTMGVIFGGSEILMRLLQLGFSKKLLPQATLSVHCVDIGLLKEMAAYGLNTILYTMGALILSKASDIVIGLYLGTDQIAYYSIATAAVLLLTGLVQVFSSAVKPAVSDLDARSDNWKVKELSFLTQKYTLLMLIPASCFFVLMGRDFLSIWVGDRIADTSVLNTMAVILAVSTVGHAFRLAQHSNFVVLVGRGEHKLFGLFTLITAVLFVVISVICLKVLKMGLLSVAWANFVPVTLVSGLILPVYFNHKMHITLKESLVRVWCPAFLGTLPAVVLILIWKHVAAPSSWIQLASVIAVAIAVTGASGWLFAIHNVEKQRFLKLLKKSN